MALPKLESPTYTLEVPSTGEKIKFRPFLVKEQKILMMAEESKDDNQIYDAMETLISSCTFGKVDVKVINLFDVEYIFLQLRAKSVGEKVELSLTCPDDNETKVSTTLNLEDIGVNMKVGHTNEVEITDKIKMVMKYPTLNDVVDMGEDVTDSEDVFKMVRKCVHEIHDGEKVYNKIDISESELEEFIDSLTSDQFEKVTDFFDTMPKVQYSVEVTNPKTKKKGEVVIEGIQSFFD